VAELSQSAGRVEPDRARRRRVGAPRRTFSTCLFAQVKIHLEARAKRWNRSTIGNFRVHDFVAPARPCAVAENALASAARRLGR
jgi:hypothetical protein